MIVFTAGQPKLADRIINSLDPSGKLFACRLYKSNCRVLPKRGIHLKDLRILERDLRSVVIVDNNANSFGHQRANGVLISNFEGDKRDMEMLALKKYLDWLWMFEDVRIGNEAHFGFELRVKALEETRANNRKRRGLSSTSYKV